MRTPRLTALAVVFALTAGMSGLTIAPAFADDAVPTDPPVEQVETPAPPPPAPAPAPAPEPAPAPPPAPPAEEPLAADPPVEPVEAPAPEGPAPAPDEPAEEPLDETVDEEPLEQEPMAGARMTTSSLITAAGSNPNVTLCHATQGANPWIVETIDEQAAYNGHVDPPSSQNDHLTDIIPSFVYKVKGVDVVFPGKNLTTLFGGIPGSAILANNCNLPTKVTPGASATPQTCVGGTTLVGGRIQLTMIAGVTYTITGPQPGGATVPYNGSGLTDPIPPGTYSVSFTTTASVYTTVTSPFDVVVGAFTGPCSTIPVTPAAVAVDQDCVAGALVAGRVQLTLLPGVTYTITDQSAVVIPFDGTGLSDPVGPGDYLVAFVLDPGYVTAVASPITVTVEPYTGLCGNITQVSPAATTTPETCSRLGLLVDGEIQLTLMAGVTYTSITGPQPGGSSVPFDPATGVSDPVGPGDYEIAFTLDPTYATAVPNPFTVTVDAYPGICVPPAQVSPAAFPTPQTCIGFVFLTDGYIQLAVISGVTYTITGPQPGGASVPFNVAGLTGALPPGDYDIGYTLDPGYTSAVPNPFTVTVDAYPGKCDLTTAPLVVPIVDPEPMTCTGPGSYELSNDLSDPAALLWEANGSPVSETTHTVSSPATITIEVATSGPSYGFNPGQQTTWTLDFQRPADCGGLASLAFTGSTPGASLALAVALLGLGIVMIRRNRAERIPG